MAKKNEKMVDAITSMDEDFAKWYTDICKKAELIEYTSVKGCMVIRPYGYAIWENIQKILGWNALRNWDMKMFVCQCLFRKVCCKKKKITLRDLLLRLPGLPTAETKSLKTDYVFAQPLKLFSVNTMQNIIHSYRDLPKLYNQWVSVVRWEKTTRPFLRSREFLWQEGHTIHATADEAIEETERMLNCYADFCEKALAMPVVKGRKTDSDKFAGAEATYAIEALMHDGKALQAGTSHYFGDGFAKGF